ncbi:YceK/YidQ family lipoprotein [Actinobacillus equuli subsp. haemolyticus]|uniref:YceK/YidQ family lipoprotein n=1 Tax=Actinobacillus equuli TaxID=718 RepID=UPI0024422B3D|nr:YceK/YidQ family lipoprotein [Actinobacillus equuli]WGE42741.1 YceK/YidQ family lipoprotein [Actinobacillus equuli subsp. haemolyticus]WGE47088.1 YceK/YidQ family lipoprotein [Actinobacillus equuli subsp. haemolyticus]WGE53450.1 YceK/YidQ family lipoprotein [Actinobacillus equuli subsp. haemolyticus]WGE63714.1 YceK/YidQ family lipoprotein [Actinobacillus equuli subsp. haemolyticus]WGE70865.1 YceK/YidQ family lipoprotein [Actinobacillus equuli subsp. haemolyticus]
MKTLFLKLAAVAIFSQILTACGTIISLSEGDYSVYAGVSKDFKAIQNGGILSIPAVVDLPLSFVLDTLMLPVTLSQ